MPNTPRTPTPLTLTIRADAVDDVHSAFCTYFADELREKRIHHRAIHNLSLQTGKYLDEIEFNAKKSADDFEREAAERAAFIELAANHHDALVDALSRALHEAGEYQDGQGIARFHNLNIGRELLDTIRKERGA